MVIHPENASVAGRAVMRTVGLAALAFFAEARAAGGFYCYGTDGAGLGGREVAVGVFL